MKILDDVYRRLDLLDGLVAGQQNVIANLREEVEKMTVNRHEREEESKVHNLVSWNNVILHKIMEKLMDIHREES